MIMSDVGMNLKGIILRRYNPSTLLQFGDISKIGFEIFYKLEKEINGKNISSVSENRNGLL